MITPSTQDCSRLRLRQGARHLATRTLSMARFAPIVGLAACTLLDDSFEPPLVVDSDDVTIDEPAAVAPSASEGAEPRGCTREGAATTLFNAADPSCEAAIGLLEAEVFVPGEADAGVPASRAPCGEFGEPERITGLDFDEDVYGPALSPDGRTLYFSGYVSGEQQIYTATRSAREAAFSGVIQLSVVSSPRPDGSPFLTEDEQRLYFFSERQGGVGGRDIWVSRLRGAVFEEPELVPRINSPEADLLPWLSPNETTLLFVSSRSGGKGQTDLWSATRSNVGEAFDDPVNLEELNTNQLEGRAVLSADGLTAYFSSDRDGGRGAQDLWTASRERVDQPFSSPQNLRALNSDEDDLDVVLSGDETELLFASSRQGRQSSLWRAVRSCP